METRPARTSSPSRSIASLAMVVTLAVSGCGSSATDGSANGDEGGPVDISSLAAPVDEPSQVLHVGGCFTTTLPGDMREIPSQPIDSIVGRWQSSDHLLEYDCGAFDTVFGASPHTETAVVVGPHEGTVLWFDQLVERAEGNYRHAVVLDAMLELDASPFSKRHLHVAVYFVDPPEEEIALSILAGVRELWQPS